MDGKHSGAYDIINRSGANGGVTLSDANRVIRVGGTKTPCGDCFVEMGGKLKPTKDGEDACREVWKNGTWKEQSGDYVKRDFYKGKVKEVHGDDAKLETVGNRHVVTMTEKHGPFFCTWMPASATTDESTRKHMYHHCDEDEQGEMGEQDQDYEALKTACGNLGIAL